MPHAAILHPLSFLAAALTFVATATVSAQQPVVRPGIDFAAIDAPAAQASKPFAAFVARHGGTWWTRWCAATDTPIELFGTGLPIADWRGSTLVEARRHALAALADHRELLGLGDDEFRESIGTKFGNVWSFTFEQYHGGIPVLGGRADVRINTCGRIAFLGSTPLRVPADLSTMPVLSELDAERIAWQRVDVGARRPLRGKPRATRLVVWGDLAAASLATAYLCWEVPIDGLDADGNGPVGRYCIDACTGEVRNYTNDKCECGHAAGHRHGDECVEAAPPHSLTTFTVMGWARDGASGILAPTNVPMPGLEVVVPGRGTFVTDAAGQFTVDLAASTSVTVVLDGIHHQLVLGANGPSQTVTLQSGVPMTIQLLTASAADTELAHTTCALWTHRLNEWARRIVGNTPAMTAADGVVPTVNIANACNAFYTSNTINFYAAGGSCNNMASGSIIAHEWGHGLDDRHGGITQAQGLSEGWGDIISMYLFDDPTIAAGFFTSGGGIRSGLNTQQYPPPSEVHAAGEVFMGFAWKFRENLRTAFGTPAAIGLSELLVVGSIVADARDQPAAVTQIFLADDNDGDLTNGVTHYAQLEPACLAHNLPYPHFLVGTVSSALLPDTQSQLVPRTVNATVRINVGSFPQVDLVYDDGSLHRQRMIPTTQANEYQALLPGQAAPASMRWHIEALHSTGTVVRSPESGENLYRVFVEARVWSEDFESGAPGWTHGATTGLDEWEVGVPAGRTAPGWSDPTAAAGGLSCAGIDLSGDGAYAPSSTTWLRSPPINCTGATGVKLRFKRWLSVESVVHDFATLRCNGSIQWFNASVLPLVDSGWVQQEQRLLIADNNPAVVIEWQLQTDAAIAYGGWSIDDVELVATSLPQPLPNRLQLLPAMAAQGTSVAVTLHTQQPSNPFMIFVGDAPGPTLFPGLPTLALGGNIASLGGLTDAAGDYALGFQAPTGLPLLGLKWYLQALTIDAGGQIVATNPYVSLFTQ